MANTQAELAQELRDLKTQLDKVGGESTATIAKVAALQALIDAGGPITQEVKDAMAAVKGGVQAVDDLIPDTTPTP